MISGTPEKEIKIIVLKKGLQKYFIEVYGAPITKDTWAKKILNDWNLEPENVLFVGDSMTDYYAAETCKIKFIGRISNFDQHPFMESQVNDVIIDLRELEQFL